jgi:redox-sensitive bicupin YhaK (pirin superfamily)
MIIVRKSEERRHIEKKNQQTWMTFDWENKADPLQNGFGVLKILNEEILSPGSGFILHTHKDMVVVTYVPEGMIIYKGPLEEPDVMESKEFHQLNAAPGAKLAAFNPADSENARVFQSAFTSKEGAATRPNGIKKIFSQAERQGILKLVASPDGRESSLPIEQDVQIYSTFINKGNHMIHELWPGRSSWLHVVKGRILLDDLDLRTGDGAGISEEIAVSFTAQMPTEILLFDLGGEIPEEISPAPQSKRLAVGIN